MTAATFLSRKWPEPRFGARAVLRCFVGADGSEDVLDAGDDDIVEAVSRHLAAVLPLPERAVDTTAEHPWPVRLLSMKIGEYVEKMSVLWVEGQVVQLTRRPGAPRARFRGRDPAPPAGQPAKRREPSQARLF